MNRFFRIPLLILLGLGLSGCGSAGNSWHRKLTVTVNTPNGVVSGSSVQAESLRLADAWFETAESRGAKYALHGEAVVADLGSGRYLFVLLDERKPATTQVLFPGKAPLEVAKLVPQVRGTHDVPSSQYPTLVTFGDIKDPKSVKEVKPGKLDEAFGPGYSLQSITLEITDEPVTEGKVESVVTWLHQENLTLIDWEKYPTGHPLREINIQSFVAGN